MGKTLKVLGWLVGMLVVVIIAAVIFVPMFVDPNDHKERIIAEVKKATGRDLSINGEIGLSVFPRLALELNGLTLSNAPGFSGSDFAVIKHAQVRVNLLPLLFKQLLEVDTVQVDGVRLYLEKSQSGATNWEDMTGAGAKSADQDSGTAPPKAPSDNDIGVFAFTIGGLDVREASVVWDDKSTGERYEVQNLHLETGELAPDKRVEIRFGLALSSQKPMLKGEVDMTSQLLVSPKSQILSLDDLNLKVNASGEGLPESGVSAQLQAEVVMNLQENTLNLQKLSLESGKLQLTGYVEGLDIQNDPTFSGNINMAEFSPRDWMAQFGIPVPKTADPEVLKAIRLSSSFKASAGQVALSDLVVEIDQTILKGDLEIVNSVSPTYLFNLDVNKINLDRYLPPPSDQPTRPNKPGKTGTANAGTAKEESLFPSEMLRKLQVDGTVRIDSLIINNLNAKAVQLKLRGRNGKLNIDHEIGRFYDGLMKGGVQLNVQGKTPQLTLNQKVSRILAGPLLLDLTGKDTLLGSGNLDMNLTTQGNTITQLKRALNGKLSFDFRDGAIKGVNLAKMIRDAKAKLSGENIDVVNEPEQTDFSELTGSAIFQNGVLSNKDLLVKSPFLRLEGSGKVYLLEERVNYLVRPVIVKTDEGQGGETLKELEGIPIPVKIKGNWNNPDFSIQLSKILEEQQKAKLKKKIDEKIDEKLGKKLEEKLPEELQNKLKDKLKNLF
ncbi:MAG: AsmA family protein [Candidatus Thiodiazotropha sp.]